MASSLFKKHFSKNIDTELYARIMITKLSLSSSKTDKDQTSTIEELTALITLIETELQNYEILAIYQALESFILQLQLNIHIELSQQWLQHYQHSDYNIPDYSIVSSMDSKLNNR